VSSAGTDPAFHRGRLALKGVVFDMDGVLLLSSAIHEDSFMQVLRPYGVSFRYSDYAGMRTRETIEGILTTNNLVLPRDTLDELARRKSAIALERIRAENPIAPDAKVVLNDLREKYPIGLATSASAPSVRFFLEKNGLSSCFSLVITAADIRRPKPAPDIYESAISGLGIQPSGCLVVEDAVAGIRAAKSAGAVACGIPGTSPSAELIAAGADMVINELTELRSL
jgi:HAD superfamily hydrolase (TIGR01509 family)